MDRIYRIAQINKGAVIVELFSAPAKSSQVVKKSALTSASPCQGEVIASPWEEKERMTAKQQRKQFQFSNRV
jgi:hypothetical protein